MNLFHSSDTQTQRKQTMPHTKPATGSTAQVTTSHFNQHGIVDIRREGDVIHYMATGPFNIELINSLAIAQRDFLLAAAPGGAWASIATIMSSAMTSPEGIARYAALIAAPKPPQMIPVATAFVIAPSVEGNLIMARHYRKIFNDSGRKFQIFETLPEARAWVQSELDSANAG